MPLISSIHVCPVIPLACFDFLFYNSFTTSYFKKKKKIVMHLLCKISLRLEFCSYMFTLQLPYCGSPTRAENLSITYFTVTLNKVFIYTGNNQ